MSADKKPREVPAWVRQQAEAAKRNRQKDAETKQATAQQQAERVQEAFQKLVEEVQRGQNKVLRIAAWAADQTARIVEYRAQWRAEFERADLLQRKLNAALPYVAKDIGGEPVFIVTDDGDGWAVLTPPEGATGIPALSEVHPLVPLVQANGEVTEGLGHQPPTLVVNSTAPQEPDAQHPPGDPGTDAAPAKKAPRKKAAQKKTAAK